LNGQPAEVFPFAVTKEIVERGRERFDVFCAPCHGYGGDGDGMIVTRGFRHPPSFHDDRMRTSAVGHYFDAITNGFGVMYPYGYRVPPRDRWAIIAYIRALQLSRQASLADISEPERAKLTSESK
jgi:mono/diheme cytochrome c family protein